MAKRKPEGIAAVIPKQDPVSIQELTMLDFYAAFALLGASTMTTPEEAAKEAFDKAEAMLNERKERV